MKTGVIDIGSNSVRLMMWQDGKTLYKEIETTRLGEGTAVSRRLLPDAVERTAAAVARFAAEARADGADEVAAFATEAVRSAVNGRDLTDAVLRGCGLEVDVLSGGEEAEAGACGALGGRDGAVVDVGGASSEVIFREGSATAFSVSVPLGAVRLHDIAGRDASAMEAAVDGALSGLTFPSVGTLPVVSIGGTATSLAAVSLGLGEYDPRLVDGTRLRREELFSYAGAFSSMTVGEVAGVRGMDPRRADVIGGGALLLAGILERIGAEETVVSEADNLEGYVLTRMMK